MCEIADAFSAHMILWGGNRAFYETNKYGISVKKTRFITEDHIEQHVNESYLKMEMFLLVTKSPFLWNQNIKNKLITYSLYCTSSYGVYARHNVFFVSIVRITNIISRSRLWKSGNISVFFSLIHLYLRMLDLLFKYNKSIK